MARPNLLQAAAAHESWAKTTNRTARTQPARDALDAKFLEQADGDPIRAEHLRKAYFLRLADKSARSRRKAREKSRPPAPPRPSLPSWASPRDRPHGAAGEGSTPGGG